MLPPSQRCGIQQFLQAFDKALDLPFISLMCIIGVDLNIDLLKVDTRSPFSDYAKLMICHDLFVFYHFTYKTS